MKTTKLTRIALFVVFVLLSFVAQSQVSIQSNTGYSVVINVEPKSIEVASTNCQWGYNYTVKMHYQVKFYGNNIPSSLYTLQGTLGCGSNSQFFDLPNAQGAGMVYTANSWTSMTNCAVATPASLGCNLINIEIEAPGISHRTVTFAAQSVLSVELVDFSAIVKNNTVDLKWETASESNNDFYTIERSANATEWTAVATVKGAGTTTATNRYATTDASPLSGTSYYRLKQTDRDGASSYSTVKTVKIAANSSSLSVYPVPNAGNEITINGLTDATNQNLQLVNAAGNVVYSTALKNAKVTLPSIAVGVYYIRIQHKVTGETNSLRYVKI